MVSDRRLLIRTPLINVITRSLYAAVKHTLRDFSEADVLLNTQKGAVKFVEKSRDKIQDSLIEELMLARPRFGLKVAGEAISIGEDTEQFWVIQPLSGQKNFQQAFPFVALSVAVELKDRVLAGAIYDPLHDEMFYAEKGQGAFINDRRLALSPEKNLSQAIIALSPYEDSIDPKHTLMNLGHLKGKVAAFRSTGCLALDFCYVAAGRMHALHVDGGDYHDVAAALMIMAESHAAFHRFESMSLPFAGIWSNQSLLAALTKSLKLS